MNRISLVALAAVLLLGGAPATASDWAVDPGGGVSWAEGRAEAQPFGRLGVFAEGRSVALRMQPAIWDVEGGAQLEVLRNVLLTGSYRLVDTELDIGGARLDSYLSGAFLGMTVRF